MSDEETYAVYGDDRPQISLIVPFRANRHAPARAASWHWLQEYWSHELPDAELVIGHSPHGVFSKTRAINQAVARSTGRILVMMDSDCYINGSVIQHCADRIEEAQAIGQRLWFIPFRRLYRITRQTTRHILSSRPDHPLRLTDPPRRHQYTSSFAYGRGHWYGAMIQIMPREGFETVGCMDPRFRGWGGEDIAFVRAMDTLYAKHKTTDNQVLHLWHPNIGSSNLDKMWGGQSSHTANNALAGRYNAATGDRAAMRRLVDEGCATQPNPSWWWVWVNWWKPRRRHR